VRIAHINEARALEMVRDTHPARLPKSPHGMRFIPWHIPRRIRYNSAGKQSGACLSNGSNIMSMNLFFRAFTQQEIDDMEKNHALIDEWVDGEKYSLETDVETAWDVLAAILDGIGIFVGKEIDNALYNGCSLIPADEVKEQAQKLSLWTHEQVLEGLRGLDENADLYHLQIFQEEEEDLLEQFDCLVAFYKEAAEKGLGALSYAA